MAGSRYLADKNHPAHRFLGAITSAGRGGNPALEFVALALACGGFYADLLEITAVEGEGGNDKRFGLFLDGGMVFGQGKTRDNKDFPESIDLAELRYSAGLQFYWVSPIGPFCLSYAEPLNDKSGDKTDSFDITLNRC